MATGASGNEGGAVDEKLPAIEFEHESMDNIRAAPEEAESQARVIRKDVTKLGLRINELF